MNSLETYRLFLGINNHFFKPSYDYFKYGPVPCKPETFEDKPYPEKYRYERLSKKFSDKETLENYLVANMVDSKKKVWIGELFGGGADDKYTEWLGRIQSTQYTITSQIKSLVENAGTFNALFSTPSPGQHPEIIKAQLRGDITLENFVLLDMCANFFPKLDRDLGDDDRTWYILRNKSDKYRPFIRRLGIDLNKLKVTIMKAVQDVMVEPETTSVEAK